MKAVIFRSNVPGPIMPADPSRASVALINAISRIRSKIIEHFNFFNQDSPEFALDTRTLL
jgi:hypothetical protein